MEKPFISNITSNSSTSNVQNDRPIEVIGLKDEAPALNNMSENISGANYSSNMRVTRSDSSEGTGSSLEDRTLQSYSYEHPSLPSPKSSLTVPVILETAISDKESTQIPLRPTRISENIPSLEYSSDTANHESSADSTLLIRTSSEFGLHKVKEENIMFKSSKDSLKLQTLEKDLQDRPKRLQRTSTTEDETHSTDTGTEEEKLTSSTFSSSTFSTTSKSTISETVPIEEPRAVLFNIDEAHEHAQKDGRPTKSKGIQVPDSDTHFPEIGVETIAIQMAETSKAYEGKGLKSRLQRGFSQLKNYLRKKHETVITALTENEPQEVRDIMVPRLKRLSIDDKSAIKSVKYTETGVGATKPTRTVKIYSVHDRRRSVAPYEAHPRKAEYVLQQEDPLLLADIGYFLRRGFRPKGVTHEEAKAMIISERDTPANFLLGLGFTVDEAALYVKDFELSGRLKAAIVEARVWVNSISVKQGSLMFLLAHKIKPMLMKYYTQVIEPIVNLRIDNSKKLDVFLLVLEKVEYGEISLDTIFQCKKDDLQRQKYEEKNEQKVEETKNGFSIKENTSEEHSDNLDIGNGDLSSSMEEQKSIGVSKTSVNMSLTDYDDSNSSTPTEMISDDDFRAKFTPYNVFSQTTSLSDYQD